MCEKIANKTCFTFDLLTRFILLPETTFKIENRRFFTSSKVDNIQRKKRTDNCEINTLLLSESKIINNTKYK